MIVGNLITLAEEGRFDVIIQGANCFHIMGAGLAVQLKRKYPAVLQADREQTERGDRSKLGTYTTAQAYCSKTGRYFTVINAYTQYNYGNDGKKYVDYSAIKKVFTSLAPNLIGMRVGYPRIGCGLAGGEWRLVKDIIDTAFEKIDHELVVMR
jgi:O-acetyl-ADP-ribose deacetylase (regulator of RNase III)